MRFVAFWSRFFWSRWRRVTVRKTAVGLGEGRGGCPGGPGSRWSRRTVPVVAIAWASIVDRQPRFPFCFPSALEELQLPVFLRVFKTGRALWPGAW